MSEYSARFTAQKKPAKCPSCGASPVASILYGLPAMDGELDRKMDRGLVVLGGCVVSGNDPQWRCNKCGTGIYRDELHGDVE